MDPPLIQPELPESIPVMALPECTLFPEGLQPLFIFEPRYREMLSCALEGDRMFCVGSLKTGTETEEISDISTAGMIRACVKHADGTSHLILAGLSRVRFVKWIQTDPFRIAGIIPAEAENEDSTAANKLAASTLHLAGELHLDSKIHEYLESLENNGRVADVIAHHFASDPAERQELLEAVDVAERLHLLNQLLQRRISDQSS